MRSRLAATTLFVCALILGPSGAHAQTADICSGLHVDLNVALASEACVVRDALVRTPLDALVVDVTPANPSVRAGELLHLRLTLRNPTDSPITLVVVDASPGGLGDPTPRGFLVLRELGFPPGDFETPDAEAGDFARGNIRGAERSPVHRRVRIDAHGDAVALVRFIAMGPVAARRGERGWGNLPPGRHHLHVSVELIGGRVTLRRMSVRVTPAARRRPPTR